MEYTIGGIGIAALIVGIVEFAKKFGLKGNGCEILAGILGIVLSAIGYGLQSGMIPETYAPYIIWVVVALSSIPVAMGYYDLGKRFLSK